MAAQIERIKACLNGRRRRGEHPAVPVTPRQLAAEAAGAVAAGAEAVHLHARGADGAESLRPADIGAAVGAVRLVCPGTPIGVSTGLWITDGDVAARRAAIAEWPSLPAAERPDFASVNLSEPGAASLLGLLDAAGVAAEAGVWSVADARTAAVIQPAAGWPRILLEVMGVPAARAVGAVTQILHHLDELGLVAPRLLHGEQATCWPLVTHAGRLGLPTRIGLEDTTVGPHGEPVSGNAELVRLALAAWERGNSTSTPGEDARLEG